MNHSFTNHSFMNHSFMNGSSECRWFGGHFRMRKWRPCWFVQPEERTGFKIETLHFRILNLAPGLHFHIFFKLLRKMRFFEGFSMAACQKYPHTFCSVPPRYQAVISNSGGISPIYPRTPTGICQIAGVYFQITKSISDLPPHPHWNLKKSKILFVIS